MTLTNFLIIKCDYYLMNDMKGKKSLSALELLSTFKIVEVFLLGHELSVGALFQDLALVKHVDAV